MGKLRSCITPIKTLVLDADHRAHKELNNAIEASHPVPGQAAGRGLNPNHEKGPAQKHEKIMGRFKSHRQAQ